MRRYFDLFLKGILAGIMISVGGTLFLSVDNPYLGAFLFGIGLFVIFSYRFALFTGKVGYAVSERPAYLVELVFIWFGNFVGTLAVGSILLCTRVEKISEKAAAMCKIKLGDSLLSIFILAIFCGLLMFIAADNFSRMESGILKACSIFLPVMVFILCGFEHCVANMFYFTIGRAWSLQAFGYLLVMSLGNAVGAFLIPLIHKVVGRPD